MAEGHLILLPKENYYKWVRAAQKYALTFGAEVTNDALRASSGRTVTVAVPPNGYPNQGEIALWLKARHPEVVVDAVKVGTPEELQRVLDARSTANQPFGEEDDLHTGVVHSRFPANRLYLFWPTDFGTITQHFGENPEIFSKWGLFGHEGVDIRAPHNSNVYACADGEVVMVERDPAKHVYGKQVRIRHAGGYKTVYGHLSEVLVEVGQKVKAKDLIGKADAFGRSHLHLTLKKEGAGERGETDFPGDILDPTPFLVYPHQEAEVLAVLGRKLPQMRQPTYPWAQACLAGVNGRVDGSMQEGDFEILKTAEIEALKLPANTPEGTLTRLRTLLPELFIAARAAFPLGADADACLRAIRPDIARLYGLGLRYFELHQSPNLQLFGQGDSWRSGEEFGEFWLRVVEGLRDEVPEARFGFPGVSPGGQISGQRLDARVFLDQADQALLEADWIGVNCFWSGENEMQSEDGGRVYNYYRQRFPDKLLFITEFAEVAPHTDPYVQGQEYAAYYQSLRSVPGIGAAFAQVLSAAKGYDGLVWRSEDGTPNQIAELVRGRRE